MNNEGPSAGEQDMHGRLQSARANKDYDHSLELLDDILAAEPDAVEARITQVHLRALKGQISLETYRSNVDALVARLKDEPLPSVPAGRKLLRGIQYSCEGLKRAEHIEALRQSNTRAIAESAEHAARHQMFEADIYLALEDHERFVNCVQRLKQNTSLQKKLRPLKRIAKKITQETFPDYQAEKVFGIGLSRTATSSLDQALQRLGYASIHWLNPHTQTVIDHRDFVLFDAFSDITVSYQFEALYERFPNARFVYTRRNRASWIRSVAAHYQNARGIDKPAELNRPDVAQRFGGSARPAEWNLYGQYDDWGEAFDHFEDRVNRFFSDKPEERFLELKITEGEEWEKLCAFLDKDIPSAEFPNVNKRAVLSGQAGSSR